MIAFAVPFAVVLFILGSELPGGDSGQWLMLTRAYTGEPLPSYRDPFAVPPAAPLVLLGFLKLTADPFAAVRLALATGVGLVSLGAFLTGRVLFGWLPGLVVAAIISASQPLYLHLARFGALPQLLSLGAFAATLAACAALAMGSRRASWGVMAGMLAILASHAPTAVVTLPMLSLVLVLTPRVEPWPPAWLARTREFARRAWPCLPALALTAAYALHKRATFATYLDNEAAYFQKGLGFAIDQVLRAPSSAALMAAGSIVLISVLFVALRSQRSGTEHAPRAAAVTLGLPVVCLGAAMVGFHLARIGTDYQRILPLLALPLIIAFGALVPALRLRDLRRPLGSAEGRALALACLLLLPHAASVVGAERASMPSYSVPSPADLQAVLGEVERRVPEDATVWAPIREGKWLEGATGREALFALQPWAIFRPWEWERRDAANAIVSGATIVSNGLLQAVDQPRPWLKGDSPRVDVYRRGEMQPLVRLDDEASRVTLAGWAASEVPLTALGPRAEDAGSDDASAWSRQTVEGAAGPGGTARIEVARAVTLAASTASLDIEFLVKSRGAALEAATFRFAPPENDPEGVWTVQPSPEGGLRFAWARPGHAPVEGRIAVIQGAGELVTEPSGTIELRLPRGDGANGPGTEASGIVRIAADPLGNPAPELRAMSPGQALAAFRVGWALLPAGASPATRAPFEAMGFHVAYENPTYALWQRGGAA